MRSDDAKQNDSSDDSKSKDKAEVPEEVAAVNEQREKEKAGSTADITKELASPSSSRLSIGGARRKQSSQWQQAKIRSSSTASPQRASGDWKQAEFGNKNRREQRTAVFMPYLNDKNFTTISESHRVRLFQQADSVFTSNVLASLAHDKENMGNDLNKISTMIGPVTPENAQQYIEEIKDLFARLVDPIMRELNADESWKKDLDKTKIDQIERDLCNGYVFKILRLLNEDPTFRASQTNNPYLTQFLIQTAGVPQVDFAGFFKNNSTKVILDGLIERAQRNPITNNALKKVGFNIEIDPSLERITKQPAKKEDSPSLKSRLSSMLTLRRNK